MDLKHRVVLSPMTRCRANKDHVHGDLALEYYTQRASTPGTLLITEATAIHPHAGGIPHIPHIYTDEQIKAWKRVPFSFLRWFLGRCLLNYASVQITDSVHQKGSFIYAQLWAIGPSATPEVLEADNPGQGVVPVAPSTVKVRGASVVPRQLTVPEIKDYVKWFQRAAEVAVNQAGFDGVMVHGSNGYLVDQFLQDVSNKRTDEYGGSIENRARFALEILEAITRSIGEDRTAIRLSPWGTMYGKYKVFLEYVPWCPGGLTSPIGMRMDDPIPTFTHLAQKIKELYPNFAFLDTVEVERPQDGKESNEFLREAWAPNVLISNSGYDRQKGMALADRTGNLVSYGRSFLANVGFLSTHCPCRSETRIPA